MSSCLPFFLISLSLLFFSSPSPPPQYNCLVFFLQYLATRGYNKTLLMEEVLQRYLGDELAERKKIHEEEIKELSK